MLRTGIMVALSVCLCTGLGPADAASAYGSASATVLAPSVVSIASVSIVVPAPNVVAASGAGSAPPTNAASVASGGMASGGNASDVMTIAGVQISSVDGGSALSFSMGGNATSSYVLQLSTPAQPGANTVAGAASSLIVAPPPMSGNGRMAVVLSQIPSDLMPEAVNLTVNFN